MVIITKYDGIEEEKVDEEEKDREDSESVQDDEDDWTHVNEDYRHIQII